VAPLPSLTAGEVLPNALAEPDLLTGVKLTLFGDDYLNFSIFSTKWSFSY
jgi:hypothetical protein